MPLNDTSISSSLDDDLSETVLNHVGSDDKGNSLNESEAEAVEPLEHPGVGVPRKVTVLESVHKNLVSVTIDVTVLGVAVVRVSIVSINESLLLGEESRGNLRSHLDLLLHVEAHKLQGLQVVQGADGVTIILERAEVEAGVSSISHDLSSLRSTLGVPGSFIMVRLHVHMESRRRSDTTADIGDAVHKRHEVLHELRLRIAAALKTEIAKEVGECYNEDD